MSAAAMLPTPGPDENHLTCPPDAQFSHTNYVGLPSFPSENMTMASSQTKERVCAMAKLSAKMQAMHKRMAKAHSLKIHARDLAAYHGEMRAIQADLIRAEIELQADLAQEGFQAHGHPYHLYYNHHHQKRPFAEETNHTDELNHVVHDELYDTEFCQHTNPHLFEDLELPSMSQPCPSTYRHSTNGAQKMELVRSNSAHLREIYHGGHPAQVHHTAHPQLAHQNVADATAIGMAPPNASRTMTGHLKDGKMEMKTLVVTAMPSDVDYQVSSSDQPDSKKRRTVKRNPTRPSHTPWTKEESEAFKKLVADEGPSKWEDKAKKLGTGRTAKALHTRWMRDQGRIIDKPRLSSKKSKAKANQTGIAEPPPPPPPPSVPVPLPTRAPAAAPSPAPNPSPTPNTSPTPTQQQTSKLLVYAGSPETVTDASLVRTEVKTEVKTEPPLQVERDSASAEKKQKSPTDDVVV